MTGGTTACKCTLCDKLGKQASREKAGKLPRGRPIARQRGKLSVGTSRVARPRIRPAVDGEGTMDVFKMAVMELKENGQLDKRVVETSSMDWRAERAQLREKLEKLDLQPSYIPRCGEIVLWTPSLDDYELHWNPIEQRVEMYIPQLDRWLGPPEWRAGVIGQTPDEEVVLQDLVETVPKKWEINYSGFRVETFPDPLSSDKSYSLHYKYVPLKCIKPFNAFELFLQGIPREHFHPSIEYALTVMSSYTLLDKYRITGTWPHASILCRGVFIGAELLIVGDAVRIKPRGYDPAAADAAAAAASLDTAPPPPPVTDIMVISEIRLELRNCDHETKSKHLAESYKVILRGKIYTTSSVRLPPPPPPPPPFPATALTPQDIVNTFQYVDMAGYGEWYRLHAGRIASISQDMVIGRCYEPEAMRLLYGSPAASSSSISETWSYDLHGVMIAREYSRHTDDRIPPGKNWFWGDFRTQTLGLDSLNGEDVGYYGEARNVKMWRANLKILDGTAGPADYRQAMAGLAGARTVDKDRERSSLEATSSLVSSGLGAAVSAAATDASNVSSADETQRSDDEDFSTGIEYLRGGTASEEHYVLGKKKQRKRRQ